MGGLRRQSCRIERWRGYIASTFFVCFPDGTRVESSQFKWRRAELPPDLEAARAAYDELVDRVAALGWERHADGAQWFATEFVRFVEEPSEPESVEHERVTPLPSAEVVLEPFEREPVRAVASVPVATELLGQEPAVPLASLRVTPEPVEQEPAVPLASVQVTPEPVEQEPVAVLPSVQVVPESVKQEPAVPLVSAQLAVESLEREPVAPPASVRVAPPAVHKQVAPAPRSTPPAAQPSRSRRQLGFPTPLLLALARRLAALTPLLVATARRLAALISLLVATARRQLVALTPVLVALVRRLAALTRLLFAFAWRQLVALTPVLVELVRRLAALTPLLLKSARRRPAATTELRRSVARSSKPRFRTAHEPGQRRIRLPRLIELFAGMVVIAVAAVVWGAVIHTLTTTPKPVPVRGQPDAVVWGNRVFANRAVFAHWLSSRGLSYSVWAKRHPDGEQIISGRARPAQTRRAASR